MKRVAVVALLLVLAAAAALWWLRGSLDGLVEDAIERHGSLLAGSAVRVEGVEIDVAGGRGTIRGITVAHPEGFPTGVALALAEISIVLEPATLASTPVVVREIHVGAPRVEVVLAADGRTNVEELRRNVARNAARARREERPRSAPQDERTETRLRVGELRIDEGTVGLDASALGREREELALGAVELRDLGGARGATPSELGRRVADALLARTARAVAGAEVRRALRDKGGELGEKLGELLERGLGR